MNGHGPDGGRVAEQARDIAARLDPKGRVRVVVQPNPIDNKSKSMNDLVRLATLVSTYAASGTEPCRQGYSMDCAVGRGRLVAPNEVEESSGLSF